MYRGFGSPSGVTVDSGEGGKGKQTMLDGQTPKAPPMLRKECNTSENRSQESEMSRCSLCSLKEAEWGVRHGQEGGGGATVSQKHCCYRWGRSWWLHVGGSDVFLVLVYGLDWTVERPRGEEPQPDLAFFFTESLVRAQKKQLLLDFFR